MNWSCKRLHCFQVILLLFSSLLACEEISIVNDMEDNFTFFAERGSYDVVSNEEKELLACGPTSVVIDGEMTIVYLTDEQSPVETESSKSIFIRFSRFSLDNIPGTLRFADVSKANTTLYGRQFGPDIPYEPNLLCIGDSLMLCLYREGGVQGTYTGCEISLKELACSNYRALTLDEKPMKPSTVISSYKKLSNREANFAQLIFTTRIIKEGDTFYGYLGGYGFLGLLIKSKNGVDWESVTSPTDIPGMTYIIEGAIGIDDRTGNMFLCGRGDDVMLCGFDKDFKQIFEPRLLEGTTTSKPTIFNYQGSLYLIVNMLNDSSYSNGRRNTANVYRIDGSTGNLTLVKTMKCKDGCAYHSVQVVDDEIWVVFQTDGRHIALEDQGRSNLALVKLQINQ